LLSTARRNRAGDGIDLLIVVSIRPTAATEAPVAARTSAMCLAISWVSGPIAWRVA